MGKEKEKENKYPHVAALLNLPGVQARSRFFLTGKLRHKILKKNSNWLVFHGECSFIISHFSTD